MTDKQLADQLVRIRRERIHGDDSAVAYLLGYSSSVHVNEVVNGAVAPNEHVVMAYIKYLDDRASNKALFTMLRNKKRKAKRTHQPGNDGKAA